LIALFLAFASAAAEGGFDWGKLFAGSVISIVFAASVVFDFMKNILSRKFILFFGAIIYPFYLIHENLMVSIIIKLKGYLEWLPVIFFPLPAIIFIVVVACLIQKYCEPLLMQFFKNRHLNRLV